MRKFTLAFVLVAAAICSGKLSAQVANDDCFGATPLGTLGTPAPCPSGIGAVSTFSNLTNVNSVTEMPYTTLINCQPANNPMASPATDVWYSFVNSGNEINITINGGITTPNIAIYQGACNGLIGRGCAIGAAGSLTANFDQMVPGNTYYIQVSGGSPADQGVFTMTLQNVNNCNDCLIQSNLTVNPTPTNGTYQGGTTVTFCYTITQWDQQNTNWLHAVIPTFGNGWDLTTLTNLVPAATCDGGPGIWAWFSNVACPNGNGIQTGFFFDGDIVQGPPNGDPTDNFGDNCNGVVSWTFCWTITAKTCPPGQTGDDLGIIIDTYGDGETGNWTNIACVNDPVYQFNASLSCCAPPQLVVNNVTCFGGNNGSATATAVGVGPFDFTWTDATSTIVQQDIGISSPSTATGLAAGTYTVTVTDNNDGCVTTSTITITEPPQLQVLISSTPASCSQNNGSATATPQGGVGPYDFVWSDATPTVIQTANNVAGANTVSNLAQGTYNVVVTDANGCLSNVSVTVQGAPGGLVGQMTSTDETCNGDCDGTATVTVNGGTAPYGYQWSANAASQVTQTASNLCPGTYTVVFTDVNQCADSMTVTITGPPAVTAVASANPVTICQGQSSTLNCVAGGGSGSGYTYSWLPAGTGNVQNPVVTPTTNTTYSVTVNDGNGCPSPQSMVTVFVNPPLSVNLTANPSPICEGSPASLNATPGGGNGGPYTISWLPVGTGGNTPNVTVTPTVTTTYTVTVDDGCTTPLATATVTVVVNPNPVPSFVGNPLAGCAPLCVTFTTPNNPTWVTCSWLYGDGGNSSGNCNPTYCYNTPGTYDVSMSVTDANGCTGTVLMPAYVNVYEAVIANFTASPQPTTIFNTTIQFTDLSSGNPVTWSWDFGGLDSSSDQNPVYSFPNDQAGCYDVVLTADNAYNCPDDTTIEICIDPEFTIFFPNAFTPTDDGLNDGFIGIGEGIKKYEMWVFDRWGNMIYYTDDINKPWDGTIQGRPCQIDVYVWKAVVLDVFDKKHKYIGHVSLIR